MAKIEINAKPRTAYTPDDLSGLFGGVTAAVPSSKEVTELEISKLIPYQNQPFKPYRPDKLDLLVEDIKENGVISPVIVRPKGAQYEILAGHNRTSAASKAGLLTVPAIVITADDDTAALVMVNTNLNQRDELLPSEKAYAYKIQQDASKQQGKRTDLISSGKVDTGKGLSKKLGECRANIFRYIRLTYLIPTMLEMVDSEDLPFRVAVDLSYLSPEEQQLVQDVTAECEKRISTVQSRELKKMSESGTPLTKDAIKAVLLPKPKWNPYTALSNDIRSYMPKSATEKDIEAVLGLIENYFKKKE